MKGRHCSPRRGTHSPTLSPPKTRSPRCRDCCAAPWWSAPCSASAPSTCRRYWLAFTPAHPGIEIRLRQGGSTDLIERVRTGDLDLAFVSAPPGGAPGVTLTPIAAEPIVLACGSAHPLRNRDSVDLRDLQNETFVDFSSGWITRDVVDHAMAAAGVERRVAFEVNDVHWLLDLVSHGLGIAVAPQVFAGKKTAAQFVPIIDAPHWPIEVATSTDRHPGAAAKALLSLDDVRPRS
ncbi:LysR substrate-binding domain-containing protein [Micromonospora sp. NPDC051006]|uniref:LysR substrate-binding domain-containing protein n=1 Tax=Micromonospora sp. NPDC051006 TaxID=3364283 RepID=UPI0037AF0148